MHSAIPDRSRRASGSVARSLALLAALALGPSCLRAQEPALPAPPPTDTTQREVGTVRQGDVLTVVVYNDPARSGTYVINSSGVASMPGIGRLRVAGLTPAQVDQAIHEALLATYQKPSFSVTVQIRVSVGGEVRSPNIYAVEPGTTLLQVLTVAGGGTERADLRHARVLRGGRAYEVDLESALGGSHSGNIVLFSNDAVIVGRKRGLTRENIGFALSALSAIFTIVNFAVAVSK
jgi:protein involved in polysaccharide export with SLBB domain